MAPGQHPGRSQLMRPIRYVRESSFEKALFSNSAFEELEPKGELTLGDVVDLDEPPELPKEPVPVPWRPVKR